MNGSKGELVLIEHRMEGRNLIIKLKGEIDHHSCEEIREHIDRIYIKSKSKNLLFDFKDVQFMDSSGVGLILGRYKITQVNNGAMGIYNIPRRIQSILGLSSIERLVTYYDNEEHALKDLS